MADQGQPLMTVPQTNLWGQAGDDLASILANREVQRRKNLIESLKVQSELDKQAADTAKTQTETAGLAQTQRFNAQKQPLDLEHLGAQTQALADAHAKSLSDQETHTRLLSAMDELDAAKTPEDRVRAGAKVAGYGGHLMTADEAAALNAPSNQEAIQKLITAYAGEKDPTKKTAIGMQIANLGGKGVPTPDATPFAQLGNGGIFRADTGEVVRQPLVPANQQPIDANTIEGAYNTIKQTGSLTGIPAPVVKAVFARANANGETIIPLTMATKNMKELAGAQTPTFDKLTQATQQMEQMGLMGTVAGRWRNLLAGESLADPNGSYTPEQRHAIGNFEALAKLFTSGTMLAHFRGRGGPQAYQLMDWLNPQGKDFNTYMGDIEAAHGVLENYSKMGGIVPNEPGAGKGGGPGTPDLAPGSRSGLGSGKAPDLSGKGGE